MASPVESGLVADHRAIPDSSLMGEERIDDPGYTGDSIMRAHRKRIQRRFVLEAMEGRVALSAVGGLGHAVHHRLEHAAEVQMMRHGHDDPAGHHAHHHHRGGGTTAAPGVDNPAGHAANDDHGGAQPTAPGANDPAGHAANDDHGGAQPAAPGANDPADHDANDDHGGAQPT